VLVYLLSDDSSQTMTKRAPSSYGVPETDFEQVIEKARTSVRDVGSVRLVGRKIVGRKYMSDKNKDPTQVRTNQYILTYYMMLGISHSIRKNVRRARESTAMPKVEVGDFISVIKTEFPPNGSQKYDTEQHDLDFFKFKDYAPEIFLRLRRYWGISERIYLQELCGERDFIEFISNSKSGNFFYYSNNGRYMIKTLKEHEALTLRRLLPDYYNFMLNNADSLLVRFCGLYAVKAPSIRRKTHFVIMCSVYSESEAKRCHAVFDLKGSTVGRLADTKKNETILKDKDVERMRNEGWFDELKLGKQRHGFMIQLRLDTAFLKNHNLMDYSLLLGLHNSEKFYNAPNLDLRSGRFVPFSTDSFGIDEASNYDGYGRYQSSASNNKKRSLSFVPISFWEEEEAFRDVIEQKNLNVSTFAVFDAQTEDDSEERYYMGIIDILQKYNWKKRAETFFKTLRNSSQRHEISAVPAEEYRERFLDFISSLTKRTKRKPSGYKASNPVSKGSSEIKKNSSSTKKAKNTRNDSKKKQNETRPKKHKNGHKKVHKKKKNGREGGNVQLHF